MWSHADSSSPTPYDTGDVWVAIYDHPKLIIWADKILCSAISIIYNHEVQLDAAWGGSNNQDRLIKGEIQCLHTTT